MSLLELQTPAPSESRTAETRAVESVPPRRRRPRTTLIAAITAVVLLVSGAVVTLVAMTKTVTITVDGQPRQVSTLAGSVAGALDSAGLSVSEHDSLAPAADQPITDGSSIVFNRARLLTVTIDGETREIWTTALTVEDALAELGQDTRDYAWSADRSRPVPLAGLALTGASLHTVSLVDGAAATVAHTTAATTVADLLAEERIVLGSRDTVTPALTSPLADGVTISITRVVVSTTTENQPIAQPADVTTEDPNLDRGQTVVTAPGSLGTATVTYEVTAVNGVQSDKVVVSQTVIAQPVAAQVSVGTKSSLTWVGNQVFFNDFEFGVNWDGLARCESTNNPRALNPSGKYTGLFQFDDATWRSVGGSGRAYEATPEEQLVRAKLLYQSRGLQPWECAHAAR